MTAAQERASTINSLGHKPSRKEGRQSVTLNARGEERMARSTRPQPSSGNVSASGTRPQQDIKTERDTKKTEDTKNERDLKTEQGIKTEQYTNLTAEQAAPRAQSLAAFRKLPQELQQQRISSLTDAEAQALLYDWSFWARDNQLEPTGDWTHWLILAGRGFGKTRTGAEYIRHCVEQGRAGRIALIAPTSADYRDTMVEGESGILAISPREFRPTWEPSKRRLSWPNGAVATCFSAEEPERLRGPQHDLAWCDELCAWKSPQECWDMLMFGLRLGQQPRTIITTTPKPTALMLDLVQDNYVHVTRGSTFDNMDNLAPTFKRQIIKKYQGTRLGRQELYAEMIQDVPGALWQESQIEQHRLTEQQCAHSEFGRIIIAVDPPVTSGPDADECGIIIAAQARNANEAGDYPLYILKDESIQGLSPHGWCNHVVKLYHHYQADRVIAEVNNGGDLIEDLLRQIDRSISYQAVRASRGKVARAEPISALYERGLVHHVGCFERLEKQMREFTPSFDKAVMGYSPDRVDALVWALTALSDKADQPQMRRL